MNQLLLLSALLAAFVGAVLAANGCCGPDVFESAVTAVSDFDGAALANEYLYWDFNTQRFRVDIFETYNKTAYVYTILDRYDLGYEYIITKDGSCYSEPLHGEMPRLCVPDGGNVWENVIGGTLHLNNFFFVDKGNWTQVAVTAQNCVPVFGAFIERHQTTAYDDATWTYYNTELEITDRTIFNVPINCPATL